MRPSNQKRLLAVAIVLLGCGFLGGMVAFDDPGVSAADYPQIRIGMSDAEVASVLKHDPEKSLLMRGRIAGPDLFTFDGEQSWYRYNEWSGPRISVVTISDPETGRVLCRYSGQGYLSWLTAW